MKRINKYKGKTISPPNPVIYHLVGICAFCWYRLKHKISIPNKNNVVIKGPALILSTHPTFLDFLHVALALYPKRVTFVGNRFYMNMKPLNSLLKLLRYIPKRLFTSDLDTIKKIITSIKSGHIVAMMPEARLSADGTNFPMNAGTAKLVKLLGVDVFKCHAKGGYFSNPRWGEASRKSNLTITLEKIFDKNDFKELTLDEIDAILTEKMSFDEQSTDTLISCKDRTKGLDNIINYCPSCENFLTMNAFDHKMACSKCDYEAYMGESCSFTTGKFATIHEWYETQGEAILAQMKNQPFSCEVETLALSDKLQKFVKVGEGTLYLSKEKISYTGDLLENNKDQAGLTESADRTSSTQSSTSSESANSTAHNSTPQNEKNYCEVRLSSIEAMPFSITRGLQIYIGNDLYFFKPKENPKQMVFWSQYVDLLSKEAVKKTAK